MSKGCSNTSAGRYSSSYPLTSGSPFVETAQIVDNCHLPELSLLITLDTNGETFMNTTIVMQILQSRRHLLEMNIGGNLIDISQIAMPVAQNVSFEKNKIETKIIYPDHIHNYQKYNKFSISVANNPTPSSLPPTSVQLRPFVRLRPPHPSIGCAHRVVRLLHLRLDCVGDCMLAIRMSQVD